MKQDGIHYDAGDRRWNYSIDGRTSAKSYGDKVECAKSFVTAYVENHPKYKEAITGKTWAQIFSMFGLASVNHTEEIK